MFPKMNLKKHQNKKCCLVWSKDSYNYSIEQLEGHSGIASAYGIKKSLCLNDLNYFHVIEGLPPDIVHDMCKDLAVDVISDIFHVLFKEKCLTSQKINIRISTFKYSNPPKPTNHNQLKLYLGLKETACNMWNFMRFFPC